MYAYTYARTQHARARTEEGDSQLACIQGLSECTICIHTCTSAAAPQKVQDAQELKAVKLGSKEWEESGSLSVVLSYNDMP